MACPKCRLNHFVLEGEPGVSFQEDLIIRMRCMHCGHKMIVYARVHQLTTEEQYLVTRNSAVLREYIHK